MKTRSVLLFVALIIPLLAWGKRVAPPVVRPVVLNGVEYSAHGDGERGWITATEINTHKELWIAKVFRIHTHWWKGEIDNQWIHVSYLELEQNALAIRWERKMLPSWPEYKARETGSLSLIMRNSSRTPSWRIWSNILLCFGTGGCMVVFLWFIRTDWLLFFQPSTATDAGKGLD